MLIWTSRPAIVFVEGGQRVKMRSSVRRRCWCTFNVMQLSGLLQEAGPYEEAMSLIGAWMSGGSEVADFETVRMGVYEVVGLGVGEVEIRVYSTEVCGPSPCRDDRYFWWRSALSGAWQASVLSLATRNNIRRYQGNLPAVPTQR